MISHIKFDVMVREAFQSLADGFTSRTRSCRGAHHDLEGDKEDNGRKGRWRHGPSHGLKRLATQP